MQTPQGAVARWPVEVPLTPTPAESSDMANGDEKTKDGYTVDLTRMKIGIGIGALIAFAYFFIGVGGKLQDFNNSQKSIVALDARLVRVEEAMRALPEMKRSIDKFEEKQEEQRKAIEALGKMMLAEFGNVKGLVGPERNVP